MAGCWHESWLFRISFSHLAQYPGRSLLGFWASPGDCGLSEHFPGRGQRLTELPSRGQRRGRPGPVAYQTPGPRWTNPCSSRCGAWRRLRPRLRGRIRLGTAGSHRGPVLLLGIDPSPSGPFRDYEFSPAAGLSDTAWTDVLNPARCSPGPRTSGVASGLEGWGRLGR